MRALPHTLSIGNTQAIFRRQDVLPGSARCRSAFGTDILVAERTRADKALIARFDLHHRTVLGTWHVPSSQFSYWTWKIANDMHDGMAFYAVRFVRSVEFPAHKTNIGRHTPIKPLSACIHVCANTGSPCTEWPHGTA